MITGSPLVNARICVRYPRASSVSRSTCLVKNPFCSDALCPLQHREHLVNDATSSIFVCHICKVLIPYTRCRSFLCSKHGHTHPVVTHHAVLVLSMNNRIYISSSISNPYPCRFWHSHFSYTHMSSLGLIKYPILMYSPFRTGISQISNIYLNIHALQL